MKKLLLLTLLLIVNVYALEKVALQLQWKHQFEFAGFYAAKEKGFYEEEGLDVSFLEYDGTNNITDEVLSGKAQYGLAYSSIIAEYLNERPVVLVANFFKQSPLVLVTQNDIETLSDLKGKKVMGVSDGIDNLTLLLMLDKFGINLKDIQNVRATFSIQDFVDKKVDAMSVFTINEIYELNKRKIQYKIFDPTIYGAKYYNSNLFTSQEELYKHPERVEKFKNASIKGWKYALEHKEEIVKLIKKKYNTQNKSEEALLFEAKQTEQVVLPNVYEIGSVDIDRIKIIANNFIQAGFVHKNNLDIKSFIYMPIGSEDKIKLTDEERHYLQNKEEITMCVDPD